MADFGVLLAEPKELAAIQDKCFRSYREGIQQEQRGEETPFWDVVLITAADEPQAETFRDGIQARKKLGKIPTKKTEYFVLPDPPGTKVGNGGATLNALQFLRSQFGVGLAEKRVLLIHAGGYSQRTPQHSVCGKIFAPLPVGPFPGCTMLEMCFAMLFHIPSTCRPGFMVKCGDDVLIFDAKACDWSREGFTGLAHRSTVEVAYTHGVYCMDRSGNGTPGCRRFTHKPSLETMRKYDALYNEEREAYTDSTFFFDYPSAMKLLSWYDSVDQQLNGEIDAYGDFLQALGPEGDMDYIGTGTDALSELRRGLFKALAGTTLNVALVESSRFWHIGTLPEVLDHFCGLNSFLVEASGAEPEDIVEFEYRTGPHGLGYYRDTDMASNCTICSTTGSKVELGKRTVVEYCDVRDNCTIGDNCYLSCCVIDEGTDVPGDLFLCTVPVRSDGNKDSGPEFVTQIMSSHEDVKKKGKASDLQWMGQSLLAGCTKLGIAESDIWPNGGSGTLWDARLFPLCQSRQDSMRAALDICSMLKGLKPQVHDRVHGLCI